MANYESEAIVIGSKNFGDTDKLITLFTLNRGKVKAMAYGARRPKNPLAAPLQMFHIIEAEFSEGKNLDVIRNASLKERFPKITEDLTKIAYAAFVLEILAELFPENTQEADVYEFTSDILRVFEKRNPRITTNLAVWKLLGMAGFSLSYDMCPVCGKPNKNSLDFSPSEGGFLCKDCNAKEKITLSLPAKELLLNIIKFDWKNIDDGLNFSVQGDKLAEAETLMVNFILHILGFKPKSLKFIQNV